MNMHCDLFNHFIYCFIKIFAILVIQSLTSSDSSLPPIYQQKSKNRLKMYTKYLYTMICILYSKRLVKLCTFNAYTNNRLF